MKSIIAALLACLALGAKTTLADDISKESALLLAQQLMDQSAELQAKRDYRASIPLAQRALEIREKLLGPNHLETAAALDLLGRGYRLATDYFRAEPMIIRALRIRENTLGPRHLTTAISLNNLGGLYFSLNKFFEAEPYYIRALSIREKYLGPNSLDTLIVLNNLGNLYSRTSRPTSARKLLSRALFGMEAAAGSDSLAVSDVLTNLAYLNSVVGDDTQAEKELLRAISIVEHILGSDSLEVTFPLGSLAQQYLTTGAFRLAEENYQRAINIIEKSKGPEHILLARLIDGLALTYVQMRDYKKAEHLYSRALSILRTSVGTADIVNAYILNDLGELRIALNQFEQAESALTHAIELKKGLGRLYDSRAWSLHNLAIVSAHLGKTERATVLFREALAIRREVLGATHPSTAETLRELATLYWAQDQKARALSLLLQAASAQRENVDRFLLFGSEVRKRAFLQTLHADVQEYASFSATMSDTRAAELGLSAVLQYKGRVLDSMSDLSAHLRQSVKTESLDLIEQLSSVAAQFSGLTYGRSDDHAPDERRKQFAELRAKEEKLQTDLSAQSNEFRNQLAPIALAEIRRAVPPNAALIEWFRYTPFDPKSLVSRSPATNAQPRYVAYVVKQKSDPVVVDIGDAQSIDSLISEYRTAAGQADRSDIHAISNALYKRVWAPLSTHLRGIEHVLVSPDGALNLLPMSALIDDQEKYLAERLEMTTLTSGRDLIRFDSKTRSQSGVVVVADANFGTIPSTSAQLSPTSDQRSIQFDFALDRGGLIFRPLPNSALEAQELKTLMGTNEARLLLRDDASESNIKQIHGPLILHIASHGFFLDEHEMMMETKNRGAPEKSSATISDNPLIRSGIALAGANLRRSGENDDGILTALEVAQLDLHGTELVVLSACDSGVGDVQNGEGVYGLRRALVLAGAQTQVTSLWKVSDEATRKLMVDFYRRLIDGEGRSAALRHAQLDMLHDPEFSHPYYWASFVSSGNWAPIPGLGSKDRISRAQ